MRFSSALLLGTLYAAAPLALAAPLANPSTNVDETHTGLAISGHLPIVESLFNTSAHDLANTQHGGLQRRDLQKGAIYNIAGLGVQVFYYAFSMVGGTDWRFPTDAISVSFIADQIAASLTQTIGDGHVTRDIDGGWTWEAQILGRDFTDMPYQLMYTLVYQAIEGATDWAILSENEFNLGLENLDGSKLLELILRPTINSGQISNGHDEF